MSRLKFERECDKLERERARALSILYSTVDFWNNRHTHAAEATSAAAVERDAYIRLGTYYFLYLKSVCVDSKQKRSMSSSSVLYMSIYGILSHHV